MNIEDLKNSTIKEKPIEKEPVENSKESKRNKKNSQFNSLLRKIGFWFLFFLLGALVVGLTLYLPANSNLQKANAELERLIPIENAYEELIVDNEKVTIQRSIYKILANASQMQVALENDEIVRMDQYFQYIEDDLKELSITDFPEMPKSLQDQLEDVVITSLNNKQDALEALQVFQSDLLLLIDNLD